MKIKWKRENVNKKGRKSKIEKKRQQNKTIKATTVIKKQQNAFETHTQMKKSMHTIIVCTLAV